MSVSQIQCFSEDLWSTYGACVHEFIVILRKMSLSLLHAKSMSRLGYPNIMCQVCFWTKYAMSILQSNCAFVNFYSIFT